jgi:dimethylamine corrinoid protein
MSRITEQTLKDIAVTLGSLDSSEKLTVLVTKALSSGIPATEIVESGLRVGLQKVGERYEAGEYFLSELLFAASLMSEALEILRPELREGAAEKKEGIVLGTVRGDIHDIGKNIFRMLAESDGFEVLDLGVDVLREEFIGRLGETGFRVLAMSSLLTTCLPEMRNVMDKLNESQIRTHVRVLLGGNAVTRRFAEETGADAAALSAVEGVRICREWARV